MQKILLRQDNADERLTELGHSIGLASAHRLSLLNQKRQEIDETVQFIKNQSCSPEEVNDVLESKGSSIIDQKMKLEKIILRPQMSVFDLSPKYETLNKQINEVLEQAEILIKYQSYIEKERLTAEKIEKLEFFLLKLLSDKFSFSFNRPIIPILSLVVFIILQNPSLLISYMQGPVLQTTHGRPAWAPRYKSGR